MPLKLKDAPLSRQSRGRMSYARFLEWDGGSRHVEWVDGEVVEMAPASDVHQDLAGFLIAILRVFVEARRLGRILFDPFQMKTAPDLPGRAPGIIFVATKRLSRLKQNHLVGPADLVVEILSPGSGATDRGEKFDEYERGGVREYWLLDPHRGQAQFFRLVRGVFRQALPEDGIYRSAVLRGFTFDTRWLRSETRPNVAAVLKQLGLV